jgi:phage shock protein A
VRRPSRHRTKRLPWLTRAHSSSRSEFNLTETLSTIKYANRARNIKNRAEVNQMEVGWDDIEHLQTTLLKLRKEHAALKAAAAQAGVSAGAVVQAGGNDLSSISEEKPGSVAMNRLNSQFSDLQHEHAALSDRYRETMIEVARLTRQVEEAKSHGRDGGSTTFAVMVQPVIEEYEKAIAQMEEELKLSRAALVRRSCSSTRLSSHFALTCLLDPPHRSGAYQRSLQRAGGPARRSRQPERQGRDVQRRAAITDRQAGRARGVK